jgi:hypothetical protein
MATRTEVYHAIDTERDYQDAKWGPTESTGLHSITEFLVFIRDYTNEALHIESRESMTTADPKALDAIRKVAGLAVACMEQHGAPERSTGPSVKEVAAVFNKDRW